MSKPFSWKGKWGAIWMQFCVSKCWCGLLWSSSWCPIPLPSQGGMEHCVWCCSMELCTLKLLQKSLWQHPPTIQRAKQTPWEWQPKKSNTGESSKYSTPVWPMNWCLTADYGSVSCWETSNSAPVSEANLIHGASWATVCWPWGRPFCFAMLLKTFSQQDCCRLWCIPYCIFAPMSLPQN